MTEIWEICIRLGLAILIGFVVGLERERRHRPAGVKTHILVCMGATVVSLIQVEMVQDALIRITQNPELINVLKTDYGRLGAQVISGIGFLGAGTIMRTRGSIKGLTTAATLWLVACIGLAVGMGYYAISIIAAVLAMAAILLLKYFQKSAWNKKGLQILDFQFINKKETMTAINSYFSDKGIHVSHIEFSDEPEELSFHGKPVVRCSYSVSMPKTVTLQTILNDLGMEDNIMQISEPAE